MHGARGGRAARSGPNWHQANKIVQRLAPEPQGLTMVIAAGRDGL